jgi:hypothetical protein
METNQNKGFILHLIKLLYWISVDQEWGFGVRLTTSHCKKMCSETSHRDSEFDR